MAEVANPRPPELDPEHEKGDATTESETEEKPAPPTCRICMLGADDADDLGRLIRPCLCKGTMAYVHIECLNRWRRESASRSAFWSCAQCGYKYRLVRTRAAGLATSRAVQGLSSLALFTLIIFLSSFAISIFLPSGWQDAPIRLDVGDPQVNSLSAWFYYTSPMNVVSSMWKVAFEAITDIVEEGTAADKRARRRYQRTQKPVVLRTGPQSRRANHKNVPATPPRPAAPEPPTGVRPQQPLEGPRETFSLGFFSYSWPVDPEKAKAKEEKRKKMEEEDRDFDGDFESPKRGILMRIFRRFVLGLCFVGSLSFVQHFFTATLPFRWARRRGRDDRDTFALVIILILITVGLIKAFFEVYKLTNYLTKMLLKRAETAILEVETDEPVPLGDNQDSWLKVFGLDAADLRLRWLQFRNNFWHIFLRLAWWI